jgi:beta-lactam-binding protein with PASTA domain
LILELINDAFDVQILQPTASNGRKTANDESGKTVRKRSGSELSEGTILSQYFSEGTEVNH